MWIKATEEVTRLTMTEIWTVSAVNEVDRLNWTKKKKENGIMSIFYFHDKNKNLNKFGKKGSKHTILYDICPM